METIHQPFIFVCLVDMDFAKLAMPLQLIQALLVMSGDVELNPGPGKRGRSKSALAWICCCMEWNDFYNVLDMLFCL